MLSIRYLSTSSIDIGCDGVETHLGVIITGKRSTRLRTNSKDKLPDPTMIEHEKNIAVKAGGSALLHAARKSYQTA